MKKKTAVFVILVLMTALFAGCGKEVTTGQVGVEKDEEFGNIYIEPSIDAFNNMGFTFGDSVDVVFDNGTELKDIPYFSGYYVPVGEPLLCG